MNGQTENASHEWRQFITFHSGKQEFGADIMAIREIRGYIRLIAAASPSA